MARRDPGLDRLLELDGFLAEIGGGYWVKIEAKEVPADAARPHGVAYTLSLHDPAGRAQTRRDHLHRGETVRPYPHRDADTLIDGFLARDCCDLEEGRHRMSAKVLKVAIAPREEIIRYTRDIVAGRRRRTADDPDVWFTSIESFAKVLSERNQSLLALIARKRPESIDALASASGRAKSNLSRTLRTMERYGLVRLEKGKSRKLRPVVTFSRVELSLKVAA
jgi:predicted transcriptional regulator